MRILKKFVSALAISVLILSVVSPSLTAFAVEDSILGVSVEKFNGVVSARGALEVTFDEYDLNSDSDGFKTKLMVDTLRYRFEILKVADELGVNYTQLIVDHISAYNGLLVDGVTSHLEIFADVEGEGTSDFKYTINSNNGETLGFVNGFSTTTSEGSDFKSIMSQLNAIEETATALQDNHQKLKEYFTKNITSIRYLMTAIKDVYTHFQNEAELGDTMKEKFVQVYDMIAKFALENDVYALQNLNLFGDTVSFDINATGQDLMDYVAKWNEIKVEDLDKWATGELNDNSIALGMLGDYSEYMLKNISASSTFRPFETNLNMTEPFSFLGEESKVFHELIGTKRKLILTPDKSSNILNAGMNPSTIQNLKIMTLKDFVEDRKGNKIMYTDSLQYSLTDIDEVQKVISGETKDTKDTDLDETMSEVAEVTQEEKGNADKSFMSRAWSYVKAGLSTSNALTSVGQVPIWWTVKGYGEKVFNNGKSVSTLVFASGDIDNLYSINKSVEKHSQEISLSNLIYTNIIEEYWTFSSRLKLNKDLDKPMFVDIYGNIVTASGIVVIPSMSNPYMQTNSEPSFLFTRSFIESYPKYTIDKGNFKVSNRDRNKKALFGVPMNDDEIEEDAKQSEWDYSGDIKSLTKKEDEEESEVPVAQTEKDAKTKEGPLVNTGTYAFIEQDIKHIPAVKFYVGNAHNGKLGKHSHRVKNLQPIAYKFSNEYKPIKSLDLFGFGRTTEGKNVDSYYSLSETLGQVSGLNSALLINEYTVNLSFEEGSSHVITFKDFPDSNEIKRYMYLTNLEKIAKVENGVLHSKGILSDNLKIVTTEVLYKGVTDTAQLNSLVPDVVTTFFDDVKQFNIDKANDRYNTMLKGDVDNNIVYIKSIEEVDAMKNILPVVYKAILALSILLIILNIVMFVLSNEGKFSRIGKIFIILYVITFLFIVMPQGTTFIANAPIKSLFQNELMHWTVIEQEKASNSTVIESDGVLGLTDDSYSSSMKLYNVKYSSPFSIFQRDDYMDIDDFYKYYVTDADVFKSQSTPMYMDGKSLTINTDVIFNSSSLTVADNEDPLMKLEHEIYRNPEFAFYLPYYLILDNLVYSLNNLTDVTKKVPKDLMYSNGDIKTTGRVDSWINSSLFLDYEEFLKRVATFEAGDKVSEELAIADIEDMLSKYGDPEDYLGLGKILGQPKTVSLTFNSDVGEDEVTGESPTSVQTGDTVLSVGTEVDTSDSALEPFTKEGLSKVQYTGWYPNNFDKEKNPYYKKHFEEKIKRVNERTKMFIMQLGDISRIVADEHLLKSIALYASVEFNKEFNKYATNKGPTGLELNNLPIERLMMSLSLPREQLIDNSITTYPNQIVNNNGYFGLSISVVNDFLLIFINTLKPTMVVLMWVFIGVIIILKKVLMPDPSNQSIMGSIKLFLLFLVTTMVYAWLLSIIIKAVNWLDNSMVGLTATAVVNLSYSLALLYIIFVMFRDIWNLGSKVALRGIDRSVDLTKNTLANALMAVPFMDRVIPGFSDLVGRNNSSTFENLASKLEIPNGDSKSSNALGSGFSSARRNGTNTPVDYSKALSGFESKRREQNPINRVEEQKERQQVIDEGNSTRFSGSVENPRKFSASDSLTGSSLDTGMAQKSSGQSYEREIRESTFNVNNSTMTGNSGTSGRSGANLEGTATVDTRRGDNTGSAMDINSRVREYENSRGK